MARAVYVLALHRPLHNKCSPPLLYSLIACTWPRPPSLTTGLYVDPKGARGALKKFAGSDPASLRKDKSLFKVLGQAGGFSKYLHLVFARSVGAQKVVDALTSVNGVGKGVLDRWVWVVVVVVGRRGRRRHAQGDRTGMPSGWMDWCFFEP